jgi:hypothetical protein
MTAIHLDHAAEIWSGGNSPGPTGKFAHVLRGEVRDYGGNVLFAGTADQCVRQRKRGLPVRLVPTEWEKVDGDVAGADHGDWQMVTE